MEPALFHDSELVSEARSKYFRLNGFPADGGMSDKWARYKIGGRTLTAFPNFHARVEAIERHDIHHIVNNLGTSQTEEGLIAAWELASGCGRYWVSLFLNSQAFVLGILLAPTKMWKFFVAGRGSMNFYHLPLEPQVMEMRLGEVRARFRQDRASATSFGSALAFLGYALLGLATSVIFIPIIATFTFVGLIGRQ